MNKLLNLIKYILTFFLIIIPLISCSSGGGGGTGTLGISLTDTPGDYDHVFVTIKEIQIKQGLDNGESGWLTGFTVDQTFDLLELQNGVIADLGLAELEAGKYNQLRLILSSEPLGQHPFANYVVIEGAQEEEYVIGEEGEYYKIQELKVPSGLQTGIKIVQGFNIEVGGSTELILDFDAEKSVVQAGNNIDWLLKPTIKVLETITYSVSGVVDTIVGDPLNGASVSAQVQDFTGEPSEIYGTKTAFIDGIEGAYKIYLPINQDIFNIVAIMDDFLPECRILNTSIDGVKAYENFNLTLTPADASGTFTASVTGLTSATDSASFSIRMQTLGDCGIVEVASSNVKNSDPSSPVYFDAISLPVGTYDLIVEPTDVLQETKILSINVDADSETVLNVVYP